MISALRNTMAFPAFNTTATDGTTSGVPAAEPPVGAAEPSAPRTLPQNSKAMGRSADGIDHPLREEADADGNHGEPEDGARNAEHALLVVVLVVVVALLEDMLVRAQFCETRAGQASG
jgi:hypothetical protein